jgi:hypothetical protein
MRVHAHRALDEVVVEFARTDRAADLGLMDEPLEVLAGDDLPVPR